MSLPLSHPRESGGPGLGQEILKSEKSKIFLKKRLSHSQLARLSGESCPFYQGWAWNPINRRCKKQQKMRWSREGLNPILQIRATITSNEWDTLWKMAVMHTLTSSHPHQNTIH
jgi:hypothetical protein